MQAQKSNGGALKEIAQKGGYWAKGKTLSTYWIIYPLEIDINNKWSPTR